MKEFHDLLHGIREQGEWLAHLRAFWNRDVAGIFRAFVWNDLTQPPLCSQHPSLEEAERWCKDAILANQSVILAEVITPAGEYIHLDPQVFLTEVV